MSKQFPKMTVSEALALGYEKCMMDGYSSVDDIDDVDPDTLSSYRFFLCEKESKPYQISAACIKSMVVDHVLGQDEVADEDGSLGDLVEAIPESEFEAIAKVVNDKLDEIEWWPVTQVLLIPDPLTDEA